MANSRICSIPDCGKKHFGHGWCNAHYERWRRHGDPLFGGPPATPRGDALRYFNKHVLTYEGDDCLTWPFGKTSSGYGKLHFEGRSQTVSRLVCEELNGPPPTPEHDAAHSCGKGHLACVTKGHLSWKTKKQNQADRLLHGTHSRGERHSFAKLTEADVLAIRALQGRLSQTAIARQFCISQANVSDIQHRNTWAWL